MIVVAVAWAGAVEAVADNSISLVNGIIDDSNVDDNETTKVNL